MDMLERAEHDHQAITAEITAGLESWCQDGVAFNAQAYLAPMRHDWNKAMALFMSRMDITTQFGFVLPGPSFVAQVGRAGPLVEIGAGRGFLSALLRRHGVDCIATDADPNTSQYAWTPRPDWPVLVMDAQEAITTHPDRAVLCAWPSLGHPWAGEAVAKMQPGQTLFLIGEGAGGCTGDDGLFAQLRAGFEPATQPEDTHAVASWPGIHDDLTVWTRR